jgi:ABC-type lipoprotein export system ATPase subunit
MRIHQIEVTNLFGSINLNVRLKEESQVTIVHAPNGYGKTTLLKLVDALMNRRFLHLFETPFSVLTVTYSSGDMLRVTRRDRAREASELEPRSRRRLVRKIFSQSLRNLELFFCLKRPSGVEMEQALTVDDMEEALMDLEHAGPDGISRVESMRIRSLARHRHNYLRHFASEADISDIMPNAFVKSWLIEILKSAPTCLIEANRLESIQQHFETEQGFEEKANKLTVQRDAEELAQIIQQTYEIFLNTSQTLDRELPRRLISGEEILPADASTKEEIEAKYIRIINAGLLQERHFSHFPEIPEGFQNDATMRRVLSLYYANQAAKLAEFDCLLERIEPLIELINEHFHEKSLKLDPATGFRVISKKGDTIPLHGLSSGEQHQLVLFYRLLFKVEPEAFVMIDEPEISLHAAWQQVFLRDLLRLAKNNRAQFLVATHSPLIVDDNWDITVALAGEPSDDSDSKIDK